MHTKLHAITLTLLLAATSAHAALCGDSSGDGFFNATDALATLRLAVGGSYDRRGDVAPAGGNDVLSASDALESLRAAVQSRIPRCKGNHPTRAAVTTASYDFFSSGGFATVDIATRAFVYRAGAVRADAVVRTLDGTPIVVNRKNFNSLQKLNTQLPGLPTIKECSVADGIDSNPQDAVFATPTKGYVSLYASASLLRIAPAVLDNSAVDPACATLITGRISLAEFDGDGVPEMDQMALMDGKLFVAMQLLDKALQPKGNGALAVVDTATDTVTGSIPLSFANPFAATKGIVFDEFQQLLFLGGPGKTGDKLDDGGLEAIDPQTMQSAGVLLTGADLQANLYDFVIVGTRKAYAIIADQSANSVVEIDLKTRTVKKTLLSSTALITDIEMTELGELWVAYRGETKNDPPGLRIFRVADNIELTPMPISLGQAPFEISFF